MIGLYFAVGNANHLPPWGGLDMLLSTNPIAAAIPAGEEPPIVLDMATTVAAYGKVKAKAQRGEIDARGLDDRPRGQAAHRSEARRARGSCCRSAATRATAWRSSSGLIAGTLNGAAMGKDVIDFNADASSPTNTGQAIVAIDPRGFRRDREFKAGVDKLIRDLRASRAHARRRSHLRARRAEPREARCATRATGIPLAPARSCSTPAPNRHRQTELVSRLLRTYH